MFIKRRGNQHCSSKASCVNHISHQNDTGYIYLVVSTHLKNMQPSNWIISPGIGVKIKHVWVATNLDMFAKHPTIWAPNSSIGVSSIFPAFSRTRERPLWKASSIRAVLSAVSSRKSKKLNIYYSKYMCGQCSVFRYTCKSINIFYIHILYTWYIIYMSFFCEPPRLPHKRRVKQQWWMFSQNRTNDTSGGGGGGKVTTSTSIYNQSETKLRSDVISFEASSMLPLPYLPSIWNHG